MQSKMSLRLSRACVVFGSIALVMLCCLIAQRLLGLPWRHEWMVNHPPQTYNGTTILSAGSAFIETTYDWVFVDFDHSILVRVPYWLVVFVLSFIVVICAVQRLVLHLFGLSALYNYQAGKRGGRKTGHHCFLLDHNQ
jgi:hypothetical protein